MTGVVEPDNLDPDGLVVKFSLSDERMLAICAKKTFNYSEVFGMVGAWLRIWRRVNAADRLIETQAAQIAALTGELSELSSAYEAMLAKIGAERDQWDDLVLRTLAAEAEFERLRKVLEPFADTADHDIGEDEADGDIFRPMSRFNSAAKITVGHMRAARSALSTLTKDNGNG